MSNIQVTYRKILEEVQKLRAKGVSFKWKNLDLSKILIADIVAFEISEKSVKNVNWFIELKRFVHALRLKRSHRNKFQLNDAKKKVLVFFNEKNQWENLKPVLIELKKKNIGIHVVSTKITLLKLLPNEFSSNELILGFSIFSRSHKLNVSNSSISTVLNYNLSKVKYLYKKFNKLLHQEKYKFILIGNDNTSEGKLLSYISKNNGLITGSIQHGSLNRINPIYGSSIISKMFVYGNKPAEELDYLGINKRNIIVSGWPMQQEFKENLLNLRSKEITLPRADLLVCLSGPGHSVSTSFHEKLIGLIGKLQSELNLNLIVKLHPKDNKKFYDNLSEGHTTIYDNDLLNKSGSSLIELFIQSKCTLTVASTAALESILVETPVITIDIENSSCLVDYINDGLTYHATSYSELKEQYTKVSNNKTVNFSNEMKSKIEKYYHGFFDENYNPSVNISNKIIEQCVE